MKGVISDLLMNKLDLSLLVISKARPGVERETTRSAFSLAVQQSPAGATCRRPRHLALPRASH